VPYLSPPHERGNDLGIAVGTHTRGGLSPPTGTKVFPYLVEPRGFRGTTSKPAALGARTEFSPRFVRAARMGGGKFIIHNPPGGTTPNLRIGVKSPNPL
jgi:hypothetical protein